MRLVCGIITGNMALRSDVLDRLLLSRALLRTFPDSPAPETDRYRVGLQVLSAHDAAELAISAIADHCHKTPAKQQLFLLDYFGALQDIFPDKQTPGRDYFTRLNTVRNNLKHRGIFPEPKTWNSVGDRVNEFVNDWCLAGLKIRFDSVDRSELLTTPTVRENFDKAKAAMNTGQYKEVMACLGFALYRLLEEMMLHGEVLETVAELRMRSNFQAMEFLPMIF
jgi:hypothetical protein